MPDSKIWMVDDIAAANLGRALGFELDEEQLSIVGEHLAQHRVTAFDLAVARIRTAILDRIQKVGQAAHPRGPEWFEGYRSAEHEILTMTSAELLELAPPDAASKGQVLRTLIRHARKKFDGQRIGTGRDHERAENPLPSAG